jgi:drug/metabolite transporter (DMT)-like permease
MVAMSRVGVARCLLAAVLFGATAPAASKLAGTVPSFTLAGLLYLGAALAVAPSVIRRPPTRHAMTKEWRPTVVAVVAGGAIGPVLLVAGLARINAASASILLNTELAATIVFAAVLFREHLGPRLLTSAALITTAGALLTWEPGAAIEVGAILIIAACACWGLDNGVTARIEHLAPEHVVAFKGVVAGSANLTIGLLVAGLGATTGFGDVAAALAIGAVGYGLSITLWVKGARELGAARGQVIFSTAPFIGAAIAWTVLDESISRLQIVATVLAAAGVVVSLRSGHYHDHRHAAMFHDHEHTHDEHHAHAHPDAGIGPVRHSHRHDHTAMVHVHPHLPDLHHRHDHA